jgi:hypothetical protein
MRNMLPNIYPRNRFCSAAFAAVACCLLAASGAGAQTTGAEDGGTQLIPGPAFGSSLRPVMASTMPSAVDVSHSSLIALLRRVDVVKSLHLTRAQAEELDPIIRKYEPGIMKAASRPYQPFSKEAMGQFSIEQMSALQRKASAAQAAYIKQVDQQISEILLPSQAARLARLDLQFRTPLALVDPAVAARFKLTAVQQAAAVAEAAACSAETAELLEREVTAFNLQKQKDSLRAPHHLKPEEEAKKRSQDLQDLLKSLKPQIFGIRNSHGRKLLDQLSEEQQLAWSRAIGTEFDFDTQE